MIEDIAVGFGLFLGFVGVVVGLAALAAIAVLVFRFVAGV